MQNRLDDSHPEKSKFTDDVRRFFFAEEVPYGLALIRICLPLILLIDVVRRWPYARELFSTDGATAPLAEAYGYPNFLPEFSGGVVVALYSILIFSLLTSSLGWLTRSSLIISAVLYPYFCSLDVISSVTKYMVISAHMLLLLSCSRAGLIWSIDAWLRGDGKRVPPPGGRLQPSPVAAVWPRRLIQLLIAISYFGAAVTKMHTPGFFSGEQLQYWMMTYIYYSQPAGDYLAQYPIIAITTAYISFVWEILFIFCAWRGRGRIWMLSLGIAFHVGTVFMLGLIIFPLIMLTTYFAFINESDVRNLSAVWRRWKRRSAAVRRVSLNWRFGKPHPAIFSGTAQRTAFAASLFVLGMMLFAAGGVALEYRQDRYGVRHPDGMYTLQRIPQEEVRELLRNDTAMREEDKFLSFNVGDWSLAGHLMNRKETFRIGEQILVQAALNPPHEDMWVEVNLHDAQDNLLNRAGQIVPREDLRTFYTYRLDKSFDPGEYDLVLKSAGREITRRRIRLLGPDAPDDLPAPVAEDFSAPVAN